MSANDDFAHFVDVHFPVVLLDYTHLDAPHWQTDRSRFDFAIQAIENGNGAGFGEAIPFKDFDVEFLVEGQHHLHRHGRPARDSNAQVAGDFLQVVLVGPGVVEHRPVHRRHARENGDVLFIHHAQGCIRTEAWQQYQGGPVVDASVHLHSLPEGMEQGQGDQMHVVVGSRVHRFGKASVEKHIQVGQFGPLGLARRPAGIENDGSIIRTRRDRLEGRWLVTHQHVQCCCAWDG